MIIKFSDTEKIKTEEATIWDYVVDSEIGIAYQELEGRGPRTGQYLNKVCHEIYFIIEGSATFVINGKNFQVNAHDVVVVPEKTPHYIEAASLKYITITRPDWYQEQYEQVD